ncbi:MAG: hypothetical protein NT027_04305 [Proteobacteria bacterium]|nr:hypothetical protein [Pseudomonadota bacterium]
MVTTIAERKAEQMLPNFSNLQKKISQKITDLVKERVQEKTGQLSIPKCIVHEGDKLGVAYENGEEEISDLKLIDASVFITKEQLLEGIDIVKQSIVTIADQLADKQMKMLFQKLKETTEKSGNALDAGGRKFSADLLCEMLEKVEIDFCNGIPQMPSLVMHPDMMKNASEVLLAAERDPEMQLRHRDILKRKKEEWDARESSRKLVD